MSNKRGQIKLKPHSDWSPLGVSFKFSDEQPRPFHMGFNSRSENKILSRTVYGTVFLR